MPPIVLLLLGLGAAAAAMAMNRRSGVPGTKQALFTPGGSSMPGFVAPDRVSEHFKTREFLQSKVVPELAKYQLQEWEFKNLQRLAFELLEPIRAHIDAPIIVTNAARPRALNVTERLRDAGYDAVPGGDHEFFLAADIITPDMTDLTKAYEFALNQPTLRQAVLYTDTKGQPTHLHLSVIDTLKPKLKSVVKVAAPKERVVV